MMPRAILLALAVSLAACQSTASRGTLSAAETRKLDADFARLAFEPPPKTIDDIIQRAQAARDAWLRATAPGEADKAPPARARAESLAVFYYQRSLAAERAGRANQRIDDLTRAAAYVQTTMSPSYRILYELARAECEGGNVFRCLSYLEPPGMVPASKYASTFRALSSARLGLPTAPALLDAVDTQLYLHRAMYPVGGPYPLLDWRIVAAAAHASMLDGTGHHREAEAVWRATIALASTTPDSAKNEETFRAGLGLALVAQERLAEAEVTIRTAVTRALDTRGLVSPHTASILRDFALVLLEQGRFADAEVIARLAIEGFERSRTAPDSLAWALARADLAQALEAQGHDDEALREYENLRAALSVDPPSLEFFTSVHIGYAELLLKRGVAARAIELLTPALERSRRLVGDDHPRTARIRAALGRARAAQGETALAISELRAAASVVASPSTDEDAPPRPLNADPRLRVLGAYVGLLAEIKGTPWDGHGGLDATAEAFRIADAARGRAVQRAVDASAARVAAQRPDLANLIRQMQDTRRQIKTLYAQLGEAAGGGDRDAMADLSRRLDVQRVTLRSLARRVDTEFPAYADLTDPKPVTLERARALLRPGEALIATLVTPDRTFVWAVPAVGAPAFAAVPLGAGELEATIATLRRSLEPNARTLGDIPEFDVAGAHALYERVLQPVRSGWADARGLLIVPHGPLAQLPLGVLPTGPVVPRAEPGLLFSSYRQVPWLARTHAITVLPTVGSLATLRALPAGDARRRAFVGFGDPWFSRAQGDAQIVAGTVPARDVPVTTRSWPIRLRSAHRGFDRTELAKLPPLPDTAAEIEAIATATRADPRRDVFLGPRANETTVKRLDLASYRVVAFATHGLLPGELTGLTQPALALSAPESAGAEDDGVLTTDEILGLRLDADWIVLSACNTAGPAGAGAETVSGLGRAFFYAGARALLVSNWPVETTSARALTTALFQQGAELSRAEALQRTLAWMIDHGEATDVVTGKAVFSYAHPIFWAPFSLVGDGGGALAAR